MCGNQRRILQDEVTHLLETRARSVRLLQLLQVVVGGDFEARDLLLGRLQTRLETVLQHRKPVLSVFTALYLPSTVHYRRERLKQREGAHATLEGGVQLAGHVVELHHERLLVLFGPASGNEKFECSRDCF